MDIYISYRKYAQDDRWITVHPNGKEEKGRPVLIDDEGYIKGGLGGKFNEQKYYQIGKNFIGAKSPKKSEMEKRKAEKKFYTSVDDATLGQLNAQIKKIRGFKTTAAITKRTYEFIDKAPVGTCLKGKRLTGELHYYEKRANGWVKKLDAKDTGVSISEYELGLGIAFGTFWAYRGTELYKSDAKPPMAVVAAKKPSPKSPTSKTSQKKAIKDTLLAANIEADDTLFGIKADNLKVITNKLAEIKNKFPDAFKGVTINLGCKSDEFKNPNVMGTCSLRCRNFDKLWIALRKNAHNDMQGFEKVVKGLVASKHFMPCSPENYYLQTAIHELGHALENRMVQEEYKRRGISPTPFFTQEQVSVYRSLIDKVKNDILEEAKEIIYNRTGNNLSYSKIEDAYLSDYGHENSAEFFAECFANSQLGKPNVLGEAMNQWLMKKGYKKQYYT